MNETAILLEALHDEIFQESAEIVGRPEIVGDALTILNGKAHLTVEVRHDPGAHPSLAHCHIVAHIADEQSGHLDACIVGINPDPTEALRNAAQKWTELVGSQVFSLLHGREVMRGVHFDGSQAYGVSGCHGFVGPLSADLADSAFDLEAFVGTPLFDYAAEMAPPGVLHLAKVTLQADGKGGWNRNLEIDGHLASHADKPWNNGPPAPQQAIVRQFAIFHYGGRPEHIEERQNIDDAIRQFVAVFPLAQNYARVSDAMKMKGIDEELIYNVLAFTPLAFARALLKPMGPTFSPEYVKITRADAIEEGLHLMREPVFARSMVLAGAFRDGDLFDSFKAIACTSAEFDAINNLLKQGSKPEHIMLVPPVIPELGSSPDAFTRGLQLVTEQARQHAAQHKRAKPWWRFW